MTNKERMSMLPAEQFYDKMMWLIKDYGMRFNNTRLAVIAWLDETHEAEPMQNKTSNELNALNCVEERKKESGKWEDGAKDGGWKCSECGFISYSVGFYKRYKTKYRMRFCPNCGADMRGENDV